jgi:hypothetical protein
MAATTTQWRQHRSRARPGISGQNLTRRDGRLHVPSMRRPVEDNRRSSLVRTDPLFVDKRVAAALLEHRQ